MATSGRAIVFSGTTVGIGLLALVVVPVPFIRSIGFGGMLIPLLSVLVCVTLLPVLLRRFGERLAWPRRRSEHEASRAWTRWARWVARHDVLAAGAGLLVIGALAVAALGLRPGDPTLDALATSGPGARRAGRARALRRRAGHPDADRGRGRRRERAGARGHRRRPGRRRRRRVRRPGAAARDAAPGRRHRGGRRRPRAGERGRAPRRRRRRRPRRPDRRPRRRDLRLVPGDDRADRRDHVRAARARLPLRPASAQGGGAQRALGRGVLGRRDARVAARLRLGGAVRHPRHRRHHGVGAAGDLRVPVRPLDGLRGVHPRPRARGLRRDGRHPRGGDPRASGARAGW